jgi:hypothetical protein
MSEMRRSKTRTNTDALERWYAGADVPMSVIRRYVREIADRFEPQRIIHWPEAVCRAWPIRRAIRLATWPPLKPASIFTTTTFEAQLLSIPSNAATP